MNKYLFIVKEEQSVDVVSDSAIDINHYDHHAKVLTDSINVVVFHETDIKFDKEEIIDYYREVWHPQDIINDCIVELNLAALRKFFDSDEQSHEFVEYSDGHTYTYKVIKL